MAKFLISSSHVCDVMTDEDPFPNFKIEEVKICFIGFDLR